MTCGVCGHRLRTLKFFDGKRDVLLHVGLECDGCHKIAVAKPDTATGGFDQAMRRFESF